MKFGGNLKSAASNIYISTIFRVNISYSCSEKYFFDISFIKKFFSIQLKRLKQNSVTDFIEFKLGLPSIVFEKIKIIKLKYLSMIFNFVVQFRNNI